MKNVIEIAKGIAQEYHHSNTLSTLPTIRCYAVGEKMQAEGYRIRPMAREWQVDAEGPLGAAYGASFAAAILKSGHYTLLSNSVSSPRFPLRALWIKEKIPSNFPAFCRRLIETCHNTVVLENHADVEMAAPLLKEYGIKTIFALPYHETNFSPLDHEERDNVKKYLNNVPECDTILWKSHLLNPAFFRNPSARDATLADLVKAEMRLIEESLGINQTLIFYVPTASNENAQQQMNWLPNLIDDAGPRTAIAFSAVAGEPSHDHEVIHPLWGFLRRESLPSRTPLVPIMNAGAVGQGGGLWPYLNIDLMEELHARLNPLHFQGAIHLTSAIPRQGGFLDASLWTAGVSLWLGLDPICAFETWVHAFRPALHSPLFIKALGEVRQITLALNRMQPPLKPEACRALAESLWAQLDALYEWAKENSFQKEEGRVPFNEYLFCFIRDIRKRVLYYLQVSQQPCSKAVKQEDLQDSFWASVQAEAWQGIRSSGQVTLLETPYLGENGSLLNKMFEESWIY